MRCVYYLFFMLFTAGCLARKFKQLQNNDSCKSSYSSILQDLVMRLSMRKYEDKIILLLPTQLLPPSQLDKHSLMLLLLFCGDVEFNPGPTYMNFKELSNDSIKLLFRIKKFNEKVVSASLHSSYLQRYKDNGVIPKGLSIKTSPQIHSYNSIAAEWKSTCESTSFKLLDLLLYEHKRNVTDLQNKIKILTSELKQSVNHQERFFAALQWLDSHRDRFYNKTESRKSRKFDNNLNNSIDNRNNSFALTSLFNDSVNVATPPHINPISTNKNNVRTADGKQVPNDVTNHPSNNTHIINGVIQTSIDTPNLSISNITGTRNAVKDITVNVNQANNTTAACKKAINVPTEVNRSTVITNSASLEHEHVPLVVNQSTENIGIGTVNGTHKRKNRSFHRGRKRQPCKTIDNHDIVVNLSDYQLSHDEISILAKGLKFVPTPRKINTTQIKADCASFSRQARWKEFFHDKDDNNNQSTGLKLKNSSPRAPPVGRDPVLDLYLKNVEENILQLKPKKVKSNITPNERQALISLRKNKDIVIFQADKGGAVVVQNRSDYIAEASKQFNSRDNNNESVYKKLTSDISKDIEKKVIDVIKEVKHSSFISEGMCDQLHVRNPGPSNIYFLPKIHKDPVKPPARPICNTIGSATENLSKWVDFQLQPLVRKLPSFLEDDNDFLRKINGLNESHTLKAGTMLVTWDVKSLYTNIPHHGGIRGVTALLNRNKIAGRLIHAIVKFIDVILKNNNIQFGSEHYLQTSGTAMGTKMAPSYANIFMGFLEEKLLAYPKKPLVWWRYIDDVFFIWEHGEEELKKFHDFCNSNEFNIVFENDPKAEKTSVPFLDVRVSIVNGKLNTDLYTKPTDKHQYLSWDSCHPFHTIKNLPYSLALRLRRICMLDVDFEKRCKELSTKLLRRGYKLKYIKEGIQKARATSRTDAIKIREFDTNKKTPLILTTTYNSKLPNVAKTLDDMYPILTVSTRCKQVFQPKPIVGYRREKNIGDMVITRRLPATTVTSNIETPTPTPHSQSESTCCEQCNRDFKSIRAKKIHFTKRHKTTSLGETSFGLNKCLDNRCNTCNGLGYHDSNVHITSTGEAFEFTKAFSCKDKFVIYLITCQCCHAQYVGKTAESMHVRVNGHTSDINLQVKNLPYVRHFGNCGVNNYSVCIIETVRKKTGDILSVREQYYIKRFKPSINIRDK